MFNPSADYAKDWSKGGADVSLSSNVNFNSTRLQAGGSVSLQGNYKVLGGAATIHAQYSCGFKGSAFGSFSAYGSGGISLRFNLRDKKFGSFAIPFDLSLTDAHNYNISKSWAF